MQKTITSAPARFREIDALRGVASVCVVVYHLGIFYPDLFGPTHGALARQATIIASVPTRFLGLLPVFLFFMISGFVIVWSLDGARSVRDFAVSRASRLLPTYWAALALTTVLGLCAPLPGQDYGSAQVLVNLTMLQGVFGVPDIDGVYWSLLVELLFYLGIGTLFALGWMHRLHEVCLVWAAACCTVALGEIAGFSVPWLIQKYALLTYGHFLIAGIMFFQIRNGRRVGLSRAVLGLCALSMLLSYPPVVAGVCCGFLLLFHLAVSGRLRWIACPPLLWLGGVSYALYVCHQMIGYRIITTLTQHAVPRPAATALAAAAVLALAWALHVAIERPAMCAIRRWWRQPRMAPITRTAPAPGSA